MAQRKDRMALLSRYSKLHTMKYNEKPLININSEQWAADNLIEAHGMSLCYDTLEYYFEVAHAPSWTYFAYNMEKIIEAKRQVEEDYKQRREMRRKAKVWLNE